jgi:hypothetical protein
MKLENKRRFMKNWFIGTLVGVALVGCGNATPPSPAGTWIDSAVNVTGIYSSQN